MTGTACSVILERMIAEMVSAEPAFTPGPKEIESA